jgi:hypothetical protein
MACSPSRTTGGDAEAAAPLFVVASVDDVGVLDSGRHAAAGQFIGLGDPVGADRLEAVDDLAVVVRVGPQLLLDPADGLSELGVTVDGLVYGHGSVKRCPQPPVAMSRPTARLISMKQMQEKWQW